MNNQTLIGILSKKIIDKIKGLIVAGFDYATAYKMAQESSTAGPAVWQVVQEHFNKPGVYCGQDEEGFAVFTNVSL